jgi:8-oxo-dGTP pyrophosphatase MutT (NUDIX family)
MLDELLRRMSNHNPRHWKPTGVSRSGGPLAHYPQRSARTGFDPARQGLSTHGGEVAFPGGRRDPEDPDLVFTALREAEEEIGLPPGLVEVIGPLSPLISLHGLKVTPFVGLIPDFVEYRANDAEIAAVFTVPLEFFRQDPRDHTHRIDYQGRSWYVPSYRYGEYKIWGLSAIMIVELVNLLFDAGISLHQPPERSSKTERGHPAVCVQP